MKRDLDKQKAAISSSKNANHFKKMIGVLVWRKKL
jgi:hypothetical protein